MNLPSCITTLVRFSGLTATDANKLLAILEACAKRAVVDSPAQLAADPCLAYLIQEYATAATILSPCHTKPVHGGYPNA